MAGCNNVIKVDSCGEDEGISILKYTRKIGWNTSPCPEMHYLPHPTKSLRLCVPYVELCREQNYRSIVTTNGVAISSLRSVDG
jgi:hypothetical protein